MRIYFCGAILGGRENSSVYEHVIRRLKSKGHTVPTEHVADPDVLANERMLAASTVYERDVSWLEQSDAMIAEISTPSLGVGYEIARGLQRGIKVLCLYREGLEVSKMITGNPSPNLQVASYHSLDDLDCRVDRFLENAAARLL